jgi:hypothetical protein
VVNGEKQAEITVGLDYQDADSIVVARYSNGRLTYTIASVNGRVFESRPDKNVYRRIDVQKEGGIAAIVEEKHGCELLWILPILDPSRLEGFDQLVRDRMKLVSYYENEHVRIRFVANGILSDKGAIGLTEYHIDLRRVDVNCEEPSWPPKGFREVEEFPKSEAPWWK